MNVRINNKQGNLGTIQNIAKHIKAADSSFIGALVKPDVGEQKANKFWTQTSAVGIDLQSITVNLVGGNIPAITVSFSEADLFGSSLVYNSDSSNYDNAAVIQYIYEVLINTSSFTDVCDVVLVITEDTFINKSLLFIPKNQNNEITSVTFNVTYNGGTTTAGLNTTLYTSSSKLNFDILSLDSFESGIYAICFNSTSIQAIIKFDLNLMVLCLKKK